MADPTTKGHSVVVGFNAAVLADLTAVTAATIGFTNIARLVDIPSMPKPEAEDINISHMLSPEQFEEWAAGWADTGELQLTIQYLKADQAALFALFRVEKTWRVQFVDDSVWAMNGFIKSYGHEVERKGIITTTVTVRVNGKPEFNAAA